jgi:hypothetical protein
MRLPRPAGFCELTDRNPSDKRMLTVISDLVTKVGNKLLVMSADCKQLTEWRASKALDALKVNVAAFLNANNN